MQRATDLRGSAQEEVNIAERAVSTARLSMRQIRGLTADAEAEKERLLTVLRSELKAAAEDMAAGEWGEQARGIGVALSAALEAKRAVSPRDITGSGEKRLLGRIGRAFDKAAVNMALHVAIDTAVNQILNLDAQNALRKSTRAATLLSAIAAENARISTYSPDVAALDVEIKEKQRELSSARERLSNRKQDVKKVASRYWGLAPHDG
jgi:hypothetical protein